MTLSGGCGEMGPFYGSVELARNWWRAEGANASM